MSRQRFWVRHALPASAPGSSDSLTPLVWVQGVKSGQIALHDG